MVNTGLFVRWKKSSLLINIVQELLRQRFGTFVARGHRQPNDLCELILLPLGSSGSNFAASQVMRTADKPRNWESTAHPFYIGLQYNLDSSTFETRPHQYYSREDGRSVITDMELLKQYLDMIGESQPNMSVKQESEVINIDADDEVIACIDLDDTANSSVTVIELDNSETTVDLNETNDCQKQMKVKKKPEKGNVLWAELKENQSKQSRKNGGKRKYPFLEVKDDSIEVVNLLDNSFSNSTLNSPPKPTFSDVSVTIIGDTREVHAGPSCGGPARTNIHTSDNSQLTTTSTNCSTQSETVTIVNLIDDEEESPNLCDKVTSSDSSISAPPKKLSKLAYKRLAHLDTPLIQGGENNTASENVPNNLPSNIYNPNADLLQKRTGLRPIVIDGNNVAISHGRGQFSLRGIQICINFFERRGHRQIKAFIPQYRKNRETHDGIHQMERQGTVAITPSRKVDGKVLASYDDRYIVQYAAEFGGVIVSTDNFRDLLQENKQWKETIENRLLMFTWADDLLMFPQDPLGRRGPSLDEFLRFPD